MQSTYDDLVRSIRREKLLLFDPLNETSGTLLKDESGIHSVTGSYSSTTINANRFLDGSPCPYFDGVNDLFTITNQIYESGRSYNLSFTEVSVAFWVRIDPSIITETANRSFFTFTLSGGASARRFNMYKGGGSRTINFQMRLDTSLATQGYDLPSSLDGQWIHIVHSFSDYNTKARMRGWVNGEKKVDYSLSSDYVYPGGSWSGARFSSDFGYHKGLAAKFAVWSDAELNTGEVDVLYRGRAS